LFAFFSFYFVLVQFPNSFPTRRSSDLAAGDWSLTRRMRGAHQFRVDVQRQVENACAVTPVHLIDHIVRHRKHDTKLVSPTHAPRSEEHTSELQSRGHLVCRLLLEKKKA